MTDPFAAEIERLLGEAAERCGTDERAWAHFLGGLPAPVRRALVEDWSWQAHGGQREPASTESGGEWSVWLLMAGRGFGKTRAGAEWVWARARETPDARIALVGGSRDDVAKVMIEGQSGLLSIASAHLRPRFEPSLRRLVWPGGAQAFLYSAAEPEALRGPEHHFAWADEIAKWPQGGGGHHDLLIRRRDWPWPVT